MEPESGKWQAVIEHRLSKTETDIGSLRIDHTRAEAAILGLINKLDQLILASTKSQATWDTIIMMIKASPVVLVFISAIIGGIIYLIKHA